MELMKPYAFGKSVASTYGETERKVREALQKEGFGILTEIDVKEKFREKLDREFRDYIILGACNPGLAWEAFAKELDIGTLLPCNVCVYAEDGGRTMVMVMDPEAALGIIGNPELTELARTVKEKLGKVIDAL